jgi:hypothetical protein
MLDSLTCEAQVQGDQKVSVHLTITVQSSGAQRLFDHPVYTVLNIINTSG